MWFSVARLSLLKWITAGVIAWGALAGPVQQSEPLPIAEFWARVKTTTDVVDGLAGHSTGDVRASLDKEASSWQTVTSVRLEDGSVVPIDTSVLVGELREDPPNLGHLSIHLHTLLDAGEHWREALAGKPLSGDPYQALKQVLSGPEFQKTQQPVDPIKAWLNNLWQQFWHWLFGLLPPATAGEFSLLRIAVIVVGVLVLAVVLWYAVRRISGGLVSENELDMLDGAGQEVVTSETAFQRAQETSQIGDYRLAVRWLYLSSLLTLEERGLLRYDRSRTNREYLRSIGTSPELAGSLRDIIDVFDRVWYGFQPVDADTFEQFTRRVTELRRIR